MYISESKKTIRILRVCFQRPGSCQHSSSSLWWSTLALHLFSFIKSSDCYFAQNLTIFLFSKGLILVRHKIWSICLSWNTWLAQSLAIHHFQEDWLLTKRKICPFIFYWKDSLIIRRNPYGQPDCKMSGGGWGCWRLPWRCGCGTSRILLFYILYFQK